MIRLPEEEGLKATLKRKIAESPIADVAVELTVGISVLGIAAIGFKVATWILSWIEAL